MIHSTEDTASVYAQAIQKMAVPFRSSRDLAPLLESLKNKKIVMLGEASHGTHEFYEWRTEITRALIQDHGFHFVAVEGDWPACEEVNQFLQKRDSRKMPQDTLAAFKRWPTWMWANQETARFMNRMRTENLKVGFHGLDIYSLFESIDQVVKMLQQVDPALARQARRYYACFEPYRENEKAYVRSLFQFPEGCKEEALIVLKEALHKKLARVESDDPALFNAIQNAKIVLNAENYYRTMIDADEQSWNVRDRHMMETLDMLLGHYGPDSKAIVWEHNTHIGDYRETDMMKLGQVNIGGLAREKYGEENVALVGFGTYQGSVIASHAWDGATQILPVPHALPQSTEAECHEASLKLHAPQFFMLFDQDSKNGPLAEWKGHRAIGVVYDYRVEGFSNYVPTALSRRYDAFIFIDETRALEPLMIPFHRNKMPETWPLGR